jgi:hypothetical protein
VRATEGSSAGARRRLREGTWSGAVDVSVGVGVGSGAEGSVGAGSGSAPDVSDSLVLWAAEGAARAWLAIYKTARSAQRETSRCGGSSRYSF